MDLNWNNILQNKPYEKWIVTLLSKAVVTRLWLIYYAVWLSPFNDHYMYFISNPPAWCLHLFCGKPGKMTFFCLLLHTRFGNEISVACWLIFDPRSSVVGQIWTSVNRNSILCGLWLNSFQHICKVLNKSVLVCWVSHWNQEKWDNEKQEQNVPKTYAWGTFFILSPMAYDKSDISRGFHAMISCWSFL